MGAGKYMGDGFWQGATTDHCGHCGIELKDETDNPNPPDYTDQGFCSERCQKDYAVWQENNLEVATHLTPEQRAQRVFHGLEEDDPRLAKRIVEAIRSAEKEVFMKKFSTAEIVTDLDAKAGHALIAKLKTMEGAMDYDGVISEQVAFELKDGRLLRFCVTDADASETPDRMTVSYFLPFDKFMESRGK